MNHTIRKAVVMALAGSTVALGGISSALASNTMYNTFNAFATPTPTDGDPLAGGAQPTTDGWVWGGIGGTKAAPIAPPGPAKFVGIDGSKTPQRRTPFGYKGSAPVNWAVQLGCSDSGVISQADSFTRYGVYADIDTAKGAWSDASTLGAQGWKHNLDIGLFKSKVDTDVTLSVAGLTQAGTQFGFTIFKGMDTTSVAYGHHGGWNAGNNTSGVTADSLVPGTSFTTKDVVAYSVGGTSPSNLNQIVFHAKADKVYTIVVGGYRNGLWNDTADGYVLTATTAAPNKGCSYDDKHDDDHRDH